MAISHNILLLKSSYISSSIFHILFFWNVLGHLETSFRKIVYCLTFCYDIGLWTTYFYDLNHHLVPCRNLGFLRISFYILDHQMAFTKTSTKCRHPWSGRVQWVLEYLVQVQFKKTDNTDDTTLIKKTNKT